MSNQLIVCSEDVFKFCTTCGELKTIREFSKNLSTPTTLNYKCKNCEEIYRTEHKDNISIYKKRYKTKNKKLHITTNSILVTSDHIFKKCSKCGEYKSIIYFSRRNDTPNGYGYVSQCKNCKNTKQEKSIKKTLTKEEKKIRKAEYYLKRKEHFNKKGKEYRDKNRIILNKKSVIKRQTNLMYALKKTLRSRIYQALKGNAKTKHTLDLLGCTVEEFKIHLEKQFNTGMNWENYGIIGWHIDHIIPCASFDLSDPEQQKKCFHYTNMQPLWAKENALKGDKILY